MTSRISRIRVFRFDPSTGVLPRYDSYEIPYRDGDTVLELLDRVFEEHDSSLSYRSACRKGKCGSCPVLVNGKATFSCQEPAVPVMLIEPHPKYEVIKDLVVDFDRPRKTSGKADT